MALTETPPTEDEEVLGAMMWNLYQLIYGNFLEVELDPLIVQGTFDPARIVVTKEQAEPVLCAVGNVVAAMIFRDHKLQEWFKENMDKACARMAEEAKSRAQ
jgi:hypothetical protein